MSTTLINIKTDVVLKRQAKEVAKDLGLPLGTIVNSYLRELVRERRVIFASPPALNKRTQRLLEKIDRDIVAEKNFDGPFSPDEAVAFLDSV